MPSCQHHDLLVLGANGPSGRVLVGAALRRGLGVAALTRNPTAFPLADDRLEVVGGDATDPATVDAAVARCGAVVSVIGAAFTWRPVDVYSASARLVVEAMRRHGSHRLVVVTSAGVPDHRPDGGVLQRLSFQLSRRTFTRTVYDDMARMEATVSGSDLDWTIVRPPVLSDAPGTGYTLQSGPADGPALSREDLATALLDQLDDTAHLRATIAVSTPGLRVDVLRTLRREFLKR